MVSFSWLCKINNFRKRRGQLHNHWLHPPSVLGHLLLQDRRKAKANNSSPVSSADLSQWPEKTADKAWEEKIDSANSHRLRTVTEAITVRGCTLTHAIHHIQEERWGEERRGEERRGEERVKGQERRVMIELWRLEEKSTGDEIWEEIIWENEGRDGEREGELDGVRWIPRGQQVRGGMKERRVEMRQRRAEI